MKLNLLFATILALPFAHVQVVPLPPQPNSSTFLVQIITLHKVLLLSLQVGLDGRDGLLLNQVPVDLGVQKVQLQVSSVGSSTTASTLVPAAAAHEEEEENEGIVDVEVEVKGKEVVHEGIVLREIILVEKLISINGQKVYHEDLVQQIIQVFPDGTMKPTQPEIKSERNDGHRWKGIHHNRYHHRLGSHRTACSKTRVGIVIAFVVSVVASIVGLYLLFKSVLVLWTNGYQSVPLEEEKVEKVVDEKMVENEDPLPAYDPEFKA
jgi:hypothetical protein